MANEFIARKGFISLDSAQVTGSLSATGNISSTTLTVTSGITGTATSASYVEYSNVANKPALVSSSAQIVGYNIFATTGSNQFNGTQTVTGSFTVTGQVVAQTLNVQQVTSSIVYSSGSNIFGNSLGNTQQFTGSVSVTGSLTVNGAGTFASSITATANSSGRSGFFGGTSFGLRIDNSGSFNNGGSIIHGVDNTFVASYQKLSLNGSSLEFMTDYGTKLTIANNGTSTFSSNVIATGGTEIPNGQFYRARRSSSNLLIDLLGIESGTDNTRLLITGDFNIKNGSLSTLFNMTTTGATIIQSSASGTAPQLKLQNPVDSNSSQGAANNLSAGQLLFGATGAFPLTARIESVYNSDASFGRSADLVFSGANGSGTLTERMRLTVGGLVRIPSFTSNGLVGTDSSGNLGVVNTNYTEIATGTITYSMNSGAPWGINNSFPATIRDYNDDGMAGSASVAASTNLGRGVTFDLGSAKAVRRIVERGYSTKNLNIIVVQYSTDNSNWTDVHAYYHIYGNTQKDMQFNPTGAISARYWRWFIDSWTEREVQNYYTYESIIYT
jgi:hypothetical protein